MVRVGKELRDFIDQSSSFRFDSDLSKINWFRVGGKASLLFKPKDQIELIEFLRVNNQQLPIFVIGVGSNLIIRDGGIDGVVVRLGRAFADIKKIDDTVIEAGSTSLDLNVALFARDNQIANLEFLSGIPGTIGGALKMNAGAYGSDISEILIKAYGVDLQGNGYEFSNEAMNFSYRHSNLGKEIIFTKALLHGVKGDSNIIAAKIDKIQQERSATQPIRHRTGGSTFKNPEGHKAWKLIDEAGCRGLTVGGAQMSEQHCNFMINTGNATSDDLEKLGNLVRKKVREKSNIDLEWEIKFVGNK